jgi:hypothetical protein
LLKRFSKEIQGELYDLFESTKWRHLPVWEKVLFFRQWFVAISDDYFKAFEIYKDLRSKKVSRGLEKIGLYQDEMPFFFTLVDFDHDEFTWLFYNAKAMDFFTAAYYVFRLHINRYHRDMWLHEMWKKKNLELRRKNLRDFSPATPFPPVWKTNEREVTGIRRDFPDVDAFCFPIGGGTYNIPSDEPNLEQLGLFFVNLNFPKETLLRQLEKRIENEREKYFGKYPDKRQLFEKRDRTGRLTDYPFDEWERYLKIFMLKQQGMTITGLVKQFYRRHLADPRSQVQRDQRKARKLSRNAIQRNFPGKY